MESWQENYTGTRIHHRVLEPSKSRTIVLEWWVEAHCLPVIWYAFMRQLSTLGECLVQNSQMMITVCILTWYLQCWKYLAIWCEMNTTPRGLTIQQNQYTSTISYHSWIFFICTRRTDDSYADKSMIPQFPYVSFKIWVEHLLCTCMQSDPLVWLGTTCTFGFSKTFLSCWKLANYASSGEVQLHPQRGWSSITNASFIVLKSVQRKIMSDESSRTWLRPIHSTNTTNLQRT